MRRIIFHRRAEKYLLRMPRIRQIQILRDLEQLAALNDPEDHSSVKALSGSYANWFRLRTGVYRSIFQLREEEAEKVLYIDFIGPRGDAY
jgi:mRNA-degrading endonuclease RelE of RelBE toxin-antitoxin system